MKFNVMKIMVLFFVLCSCPQIVSSEEQAQSPSEPYIAKFGDEGITYSDFNTYVKAIEQRQGMRMTPQAKESFLTQLITKKMVYKHALSNNFDKDPEVSKKIREATVEVIYSMFLKRNIKDTEATEEEAREYYNKNMEKYTVPELYSGTIYYVYKKSKSGEDVSAKSRDSAEEIKQYIIDNNFQGNQDVMKTFVDRYPDFLFNSYELRSYWKGKQILLPKNLIEEFLKLKKQEISISEQNDYYAVIVVSDVMPSKQEDFRFSKNKIIAEMEAERYQKAYDELFAKLAKEYNLTIDKSLISNPEK